MCSTLYPPSTFILRENYLEDYSEKIAVPAFILDPNGPLGDDRDHDAFVPITSLKDDPQGALKALMYELQVIEPDLRRIAALADYLGLESVHRPQISML
jgi:hypothetical protein